MYNRDLCLSVGQPAVTLAKHVHSDRPTHRLLHCTRIAAGFWRNRSSASMSTYRTVTARPALTRHLPTPFSTTSSRSTRTARHSVAQKQQQPQTQLVNTFQVPKQQLLDQASELAARLACVGAAAVLCMCWSPEAAFAAGRKAPPISESAGRCDVAALDKFADTRATFSQEASGGNMTEAIVDIRGCDFSNKDLSGKVFSGVLLQGANLSNTRVVGSQFARAQAQGAIMVNTDFTDTNLYGTSFDGADVRGAQFENSILTGATFGKDSAGNWANLAGAHFEGALVSSSDIGRICENPTLEADTKRYELGCRASR